MTRPIGLIGVGLMGTAIAERLLKHGFQLLGWDLNPDRCADLMRLSGSCAEGIEQVFSSCDFVLLSLPTDEIVRSVLEEHSPQLRTGQFVIDTSTGDPQAAVAVAQGLERCGVDYLDATISGSSDQVRTGSAVALVGASETAWIACQSLLASIASQVLHVGPPGSGSQMKLVTNLVLGLNRARLPKD